MIRLTCKRYCYRKTIETLRRNVLTLYSISGTGSYLAQSLPHQLPGIREMDFIASSLISQLRRSSNCRVGDRSTYSATRTRTTISQTRLTVQASWAMAHSAFPAQSVALL